MLEIGPQDLLRRLSGGSPPRLLDVREDFEVESGVIPGARHIPMGELSARLPELGDPSAPLVVVCEHGVRSLHVVRALRSLGYADPVSLAGGMDLWRRSG